MTSTHKDVITLRECDLARNPRTPNKDKAYKYIQHLPVAKEGFRHIKNTANAGYRRAELLVWNMALNGQTSPVILFHAWQVESKTMHIAYNRLDDLAARTRAIISAL